MKQALLVAWRSASGNLGWGPVGRLDFDGTCYRYVYTQGARTLEGFRPFVGMDDLEEIYESETLFPIFANRLLPKSRPEYDAFLRWGEFDPNNPPDPISILGVTEGIRQTDSIEVFPCPTPDSMGCYVNKFFVHGLRYLPPQSLARLAKLESGEILALMPDPFNQSDLNAVALRTTLGDRMLVGYVPRYLGREVGQLLTYCNPSYMEVRVKRVNADAPLQQRLLCQMNACWPDGFRPCSDASFLPIPQEVQVDCPA